MLYLLDTSTCVFFLRGRLNLDKIFLDRGVENCYISELTIFEMKYGAQSSVNPKKSHEAVNRFVGGLKVMPILGIAEKYAEVKVQLIKNGTPMHDEFDLIIGVTALENNLTLVTDNVKDFRFIEGLKIENWMSRV